LHLNPSPIIELNRAAAIAMRDGPAAGLNLLDDLLARKQLLDYYLLHAARADLLAQLGELDAATAAYATALELTGQEPERRFLHKKMSGLKQA
jgi:RNA polymerase sigma-70 factor (ECF subfamily)